MANNIPADPNWWPHRYDAVKHHVHFIQATREDHRTATFLTDEYLKGAANPKAVAANEAVSNSGTAPVHFIFHSAYCCSTLLARAFDVPSVAMGYKEPQILNDISGLQMRGTPPQELAQITDVALGVLARPFEAGETLVIKPSNIVNSLAGLMLHLRPQAKALFLYAPLSEFLGSIARKGLWGRNWVRDLMVKQKNLGMINLGFEGDDYLMLTDLQVAAVGWLAQHALFNQIIGKFGRGRVQALSSSRLMAAPDTAMQNLVKHFDVSMGSTAVEQLVSGPVFNQHSKSNEAYDAAAREAERKEGDTLHADEIEKVTIWAEAVAKNVGLSLEFPNQLI